MKLLFRMELIDPLGREDKNFLTEMTVDLDPVNPSKDIKNILRSIEIRFHSLTKNSPVFRWWHKW